MDRLCGGTFFVLLSEARKKMPPKAESYKGKKSGITEVELLAALSKLANPDLIITPNDICESGTLRNNTGAFRGCVDWGGTTFQLHSPATIVSFNRRYQTDYKSLLNDMGNLIDYFIDPSKDTLLVKALMELIIQDEIITDNYKFNTGRLISRSELSKEKTINTTAFILSVWHYVLTIVDDNKAGQETFERWCPKNNHGRRDYRGTIGEESVLEVTASRAPFTPDANQQNVNIITKVKHSASEAQISAEIEELDITLDQDEFEAVFYAIDHNEALTLKNKSGISLYYLDISSSEFDYMSLNEYLLNTVGMYVYSRTRIKEFIDKKRTQSIGIKALRLMNENGSPNEKGTGNELGEMLVFTFMEGGLHAPKLLSKVEITTEAQKYKSRSDSVHLLKRKIDGKTSYQLVFGASSISCNITDAIDAAFEVLVAIKGRHTKEREMVDNTLFNNTYDSETTEYLKQILIPSKRGNTKPDMAFGVFIGYSINVTEYDNDDFRTLAVEKMKADIRGAIPYIEKKAIELNLTMHSYYFYFLPFNDAENDKKQIMNELLGGAG